MEDLDPLAVVRVTVHPGVGESQGASGRIHGATASPKRVVFASEGEKRVVAPEDCSCLFRGCESLASLDLSPLNTSKVWNMEIMFYLCTSLASIDLKPLGTSRVTEMSGMFSGCESLTSIDLSGLDTYTRLEGGNRYETSKAIAEWEVSQKKMTYANAAVATGANFLDVLAGIALCGRNNSVMILANDADSASLQTLYVGKAGVGQGYFLGGEAAVGAALVSEVERKTA